MLMESFLLIAKSSPREYFTLSLWDLKTGIKEDTTAPNMKPFAY